MKSYKEEVDEGGVNDFDVDARVKRPCEYTGLPLLPLLSRTSAFVLGKEEVLREYEGEGELGWVKSSLLPPANCPPDTDVGAVETDNEGGAVVSLLLLRGSSV
jgi:hypothetical protein